MSKGKSGDFPKEAFNHHEEGSKECHFPVRSKVGEEFLH